MKPITIVGGGLAGLTLGILLRRAGAPTTIIEAGLYPRHRVCGEFISGRGRAVLRELGLEEKLFAAGAREAATAAFYSGRVEAAPRPLPEPALCLSRHAMDRCLAAEFRALGGELRDNERWRGAFGPGIVRATGRRVDAPPGGWRWFGLKAHFRGATLEADLEVHLSSNGYVGLCRLDGATVNACGLFRSRAAVPDLASSWREWLTGAEGSALRQRMAGAEPAPDSFASVAGLELRPQRAAHREECCLGDAITMIAPLTGNGMSMALESARLARDPLLAHGRGESSWPETAAAVAARCDAAFRRRLFWAARLQEAFFCRGLAKAVLWLGGRSPWVWRQLFRRTR